MCARGKQLVHRCAVVVAIVLYLSPSSWSQWDARPPGRLAALTSGPVAIPLVATLESLSVSALPAAPLVSGGSSDREPALTVTTAWTIRANCTTVRLSSSSGVLAAFASDPFSGSDRKRRGVFPGRGDPTLSPYETDWPGIAQPVGATGRPGSRRDNIEINIDGKDKFDPQSPPAAVYVFAQAL